MDEDMAGACGAYGGEMEPGISIGNLKDTGVNDRMLLKYISKKRNRMGWYDWVHLAQDRNKWQALVNTAMNLRLPYKVWNFLTS